MRSSIVRFSSGLALAIALGASAVPAGAHPQPPPPKLDVANPRAGALLTAGAMYIQGMAYDDSAEKGAGVDRVSVFLGDRDEQNGALFLGDATLGLPSTETVVREECASGPSRLCPAGVARGDPQFALAGWRVKTPPLKNTGQQTAIYVYARSSVTGIEAVEVIPVVVGGTSGGDTGGGGGEG
jgi:hypothetical protein